MKIATVTQRALATNLRTIAVSDAEKAGLDSSGIHEPTLQRYFTWRRSMVLLVVMATILSAGLTTILKLTGRDDRPEVFQTLEDGMRQQMEKALPETGKFLQTGEKPKAAAEPDDEEEKPQTAFAKFEEIMHAAHLYVLALASLAVLACGNRFKISFKILLAGFVLGFFLPMAMAMCPWSWWGVVEPDFSPEQEPAKYFQSVVEGIMEGANYLVVLLPTVLSLLPGTMRACLRVKTLLPESLLPGWFIVVTSALYTLFLLVIFVAVDQITSDPLVLGGLFLFMLSPLIYVVRAGVFTSPLLSVDDYNRMSRVQLIVGVVTLAAGGLFVAWLLTHDLFGVHLVGLNAKKSLLHPMDLVNYALEYLARSLFVTVLGADLFMRMNLTAWQQSRVLAGSEGAKAYDRAMDAMEGVSK